MTASRGRTFELSFTTHFHRLPTQARATTWDEDQATNSHQDRGPGDYLKDDNADADDDDLLFDDSRPRDDELAEHSDFAAQIVDHRRSGRPLTTRLSTALTRPRTRPSH